MLNYSSYPDDQHKHLGGYRYAKVKRKNCRNRKKYPSN